MASFLDGFASSFTDSFSAVAGAKSRRAALREQQREFDISSGYERERLDIQKAQEEREKEKSEYEITQRPAAEAAAAAQTELQLQQAASAKEDAIRKQWENQPEQRDREVRKTEADIDKMVADGRLTNAQADQLIAQLPYEGAKIKAYIDNINAQTDTIKADIAKKQMENEVFYGGTLAPARKLFQKYFGDNIPPPMKGSGAEGAEPAGAIPEGEDTEEPNPALSEPTVAARVPVEPTAVPRDAAGNVITEPSPPAGPAVQPSRTPAPASSAVPPPEAAPTGPTAGPAIRPGYLPPTPTTQAPYEARTPQPRPDIYITPSIRGDRSAPPAWRPPQPTAPVGRPEYTQQQPGYNARPQQPARPPSPAIAVPPPRGERATQPSGQRELPPTPQSAIPSGIQQASYTPGEGNVIEAQAGTRRLPLNDRTRTMLEQASAATGLDVRVTSGAQESHGPNRTGSHRHDVDVGAADLQLIDRSTGQPVNMNTPEGQQQIVEFMRAARDAGATGFGAGVDYMGDNTIHVGFGDPGVWGAGGKGANAPEWLVAGMSGGVGGRPSAIPAGEGARPAGVARAYQGLQARDMPQMQAAVLAGNIQQESSGDPNSVNAAEGAEGIIQWRQDRLDKLKAFADEQGTDYRDLDTQLDFLIEEGERRGSGQDQAAWTEFMSATTPEAANAALKKFIRYGDESASTRLEYANNLLRGGGGEIRGERREMAEAGRQRLPTPRGEVTQQVRRQRIIETSHAAVKDGLKAIYASVQQPGAMPTQDRTQALTGIVSNEGAAPPQLLADARQAVQQTAREPMTEAELNLATLTYAYEWALTVEKDPEKAQGIAKEILNSYTRTSNMFSTIAKQQMQAGNMNEGVKALVRAYAYIPDGQEADISQDRNGNYVVTMTDLATGKLVQRQVLTPDQMYAQAMGWKGTTDVHRQLMRAAGQAVPSRAFEAGQAQMAAPLEAPEGMPGELTRRAIPEAIPLNQAQFDLSEQMTKEERDDYNTMLAARNTRIAAANEAIQPPALATRENIDAQLQRMRGIETSGAEPNEYMVSQAAPGSEMHQIFGNRLNGIFSSMLQSNPGAVAETVVDDLATAATQATADFNRLPMKIGRGDYEGTWKITFPTGSEYNLPAATAKEMRDTILRYQAGKEAGAEAAIAIQAQDAAREAARGATTRDIEDRWRANRGGGDYRYVTPAPSYRGPIEPGLQRRQ